MTEIKLRAYNPVYIDLGDTRFESIDLPYASSKRFRAIMEEVETLDEGDAGEDRGIELLMEGFDLLLKPSEGGDHKPSTFLQKGIDSGEITPRTFLALWTDLWTAIAESNGTDEAEGQIDRPT